MLLCWLSLEFSSRLVAKFSQCRLWWTVLLWLTERLNTSLLLTGGQPVLLCAAWWSWSWPSTTWACCVARWVTTSTPRPPREAASPIREERCSWRESNCRQKGLNVNLRVKLWKCIALLLLILYFTTNPSSSWPPLWLNLFLSTVLLALASSSPGCWWEWWLSSF